jgi:hypothetical protein
MLRPWLDVPKISKRVLISVGVTSVTILARVAVIFPVISSRTS